MRSLVKAGAVARGSVKDVAEAQGISIEAALMQAEVIVLIDQSGSMSAGDAANGLSRFDKAEEELRRIQEAYPGAVVVVQFSDAPEFLPGGVPTRIGSDTNMTAALRWIKNAGADGLFTVVLISDGEPTSPHARTSADAEREVLDFAATLRGSIHTIFIGPESDMYGGRAFLERLAHATGGQKFVARKPGELAPGVIALLTGG